jgi:uncharacterized protein YggT (Ycf19 family)
VVEEPVTVVQVHERPQGLARVLQFIDYLFWLLYVLLFIRLVLIFIGTGSFTGFAQFIQTATNPFFAPFRGITSSPTIDEYGHVLAVPVIVAMLVYALLQFAIHKLFRVISYRQTTIT